MVHATTTYGRLTRNWFQRIISRWTFVIDWISDFLTWHSPQVTVKEFREKGMKECVSLRAGFPNDIIWKLYFWITYQQKATTRAKNVMDRDDFIFYRLWRDGYVLERKWSFFFFHFSWFLLDFFSFSSHFAEQTILTIFFCIIMTLSCCD